MNLNEFGNILEEYGSDRQNWPKSVREHCDYLLAHTVEAEALLAQHQRRETALELVLEQAKIQMVMPEFPGLEARVLNQTLPPQPRPLADRLIEWLLPANPFSSQLWRPLTAACLPLVFGIVVGNFFSFGVATETPGYEYWDDELYVLSLNDYTENLL